MSKVKAKLAPFVGFLGKLVPERRALAEVLETIALGIALDPKDRDKVLTIIHDVKTSAESIEGSLDNVAKFEATGFSKDELKALVKEAVAELLPDLLGGIVEAQMRANAEAAVEGSQG